MWQRLMRPSASRASQTSFIEKNEDSFGWVGEHASLDSIQDPQSEFGRQICLKSQTAHWCQVTKTLRLLTRLRPKFFGRPFFIRLICHFGAPYLGGVFT